nr:DUF433 domain-containing protein [uncultured Rhodopila sp.]
MRKTAKSDGKGPDLSRVGIYSVSEAAILLGVAPQRIRGWVQGWSGASRAPIVENDLGRVDKRNAFSFANLMELRFIAFFSDANVSLHEIRSIMDEVRAELNRPHPFATNLVFKTDGAKIVAEIAHKNGVSDIYDLRSRNFEMGAVVYKTLKDGMVFDPKGNAQAWYPRQSLAPNVLLHPCIAFGRPVLKGSGIPTEAIADAVRAEGSIDTVAELFEITKRRVQEAVTFESHLRRAA